MISLRGNAAIHYLPLSESGAADRLPTQTGHRKRMVFATSSEFSAQRPTGAGLMLGMGLRDICGEAGRRCCEGGRLWSVADPACPDGAASHLIGLAGFLARSRRVSVKTRLPMFLACAPHPTGAMDAVVHCGNNEPPFSLPATNRAAHIEKPENQSLWGYRFRVVPWRDKVSAFPRGFFC